MAVNLLTPVVSKALDGLFMRQQAQVHNIANASSPGFRPVRVSFEDALQQAVALAESGNSAAALDKLAAAVPQMSAPSLAPGDSFRLDLEVSKVNETSTQYSMLIGMLDRSNQLKQLAITGGR
ncbi:flagellar basal body rod protein FlgB [Paraherbaspirillum soli]|uniref:Flagellar basal body rod protein FlgB n=1 Tax=Paraherbaspirillum soli TaxID=631222 RepID=A0ABW0MD13_9BURK